MTQPNLAQLQAELAALQAALPGLQNTAAYLGWLAAKWNASWLELRESQEATAIAQATATTISSLSRQIAGG